MTRPRIQIDLNAPTPANRQIVDQVRTLLVDGVIPPGETLPSVRRLAVDLGVHFNTVADAYRILADEGWLAIVHGRGVEVLSRQAPSADRETQGRFRQRLRQLVAEARADGVSFASVVRELSSLAESIKS